ncbi:hypothetical protein RFF05_06815 [Bengtsoniella intestinalis]
MARVYHSPPDTWLNMPITELVKWISTNNALVEANTTARNK